MYGLMILNMMENGMIIRYQEKGSIIGLMGEFMMVIG